ALPTLSILNCLLSFRVQISNQVFCSSFFKKIMPTRATTSSSAAPPAPSPSARIAWETVRGEILAWCRDELSRNGGDFGLPILDFIFDRVIRYTRGNEAAFQEVEDFTPEERELLDEVASAVTTMSNTQSSRPLAPVCPCRPLMAKSAPRRLAVLPGFLAVPGLRRGTASMSETSSQRKKKAVGD
ncbi:hypothetical protein QBC41DRAFT_222082, partial [Cercophora samala]